MNVAIIGAQGHLGSALYKRFGGIKDPSVHLHPTVDKTHNAELASGSDAVLIVVQPKNVASVLNEIAPHLKQDCRIISFAAMYPLASVSHLANRPSARIRTDPWWNISAYVLDTAFSKHGLEFLFGKLTKKSRQVGTDREVDEMLVLISYIFAASLLQRSGEIDAREHLDFLSRYPLVAVSSCELVRFAPEGNVQEQLRTLSTKGGITERIVLALRKNDRIPPEQLFEQVLKSLQ